MRCCVLLDAEARKAVPVKAKSGESLMKIAHRLIECEMLQLVPLYPNRLPAMRPSTGYLKTVQQGYADFWMDINYLMNALVDTWEVEQHEKA